jgi:catecholate siderophore receptor
VASKRIKKAAGKRRLGGSRYWMAMGTLAAYSAAGGGRVAWAQQKQPDGSYTRAVDAIQALPVRRFDIPAGPLATALRAFQAASGLKVDVAQPDLLSVQSEGVTGLLTPAQALDLLLAKTGLVYRVTAPSSVTIDLKSSVTSVEVTETASALEGSLSRYTQPLSDTPQTVNVVPQLTMQQQGTTTLRDALRNVAGISLAAGEGGSQGDNLTIRGFTARNDLFIDGMRDFGSYYRDPFDTQEVEVLQGPSSVTFGRGSTGGVVNQASKTPGLTPAISGDLDFGTDATRRATVDIDQPLPKLGSGAAFRLNAMGDIGDVAGRDVAEVRRDGFAPSLALGLGGPTRLTLSYFHQNADDVPDYGIPWVLNQPAPVNRSNYYGLENGNFLRTYDDIGTAKVEHDVNKHVVFRDQIRYAHYVRDALITEAQLATTPATPLDMAQITRHEIGVNSTETYLDDQADLTARFETGPIRHTLTTGIEAGRETSDPTRPTFTAPNTSLLNPDPGESLNPGVTIASKVTDSALTASAYALDTVNVGKRWEFTGGLRFDRFDDTYKQFIAPASEFHRVDQKPTWRAAAVYKPVSFGSLYFDAGTSFNPSAESLSLSAGTANLPPETNKTYEFGTKWEFNRNRFVVNSSWFRTTKDNAREASPTNSLLYVLAGNQRVSGVELTAQGRLTSRWELLGSYAYLDSRVVSSQFYPQSIGYPLANVPRNTFNFWSTYRLPHHFEFGTGANYESSRTASSTVPLDPTTGLVREAPGYWVFNAMGSHPINEHVAIQVNVYNLANRFYYDELHPAHVVPGAGRSALIGFKFKF